MTIARARGSQSDSGRGLTAGCLPIEELKRYRQIDARETAVTERFSRNVNDARWSRAPLLVTGFHTSSPRRPPQQVARSSRGDNASSTVSRMPDTDPRDTSIRGPTTCTFLSSPPLSRYYSPARISDSDSRVSNVIEAKVRLWAHFYLLLFAYESSSANRPAEPRKGGISLRPASILSSLQHRAV